MRVSNTGYVTIQKQSLLGMVSTLGVPTGKTRVLPGGETEAEFICINPGSECSTIWATKDMLITHPPIN